MEVYVTKRELQVLRLAALDNRYIADHLGISITTVKMHFKKLYMKLKCNNKRQLILKSIRLSLMRPEQFLLVKTKE